MELLRQDAVIVKACGEGERHAALAEMFGYRDAQLIAELQVEEREIDLLAVDESDALIDGLRGPMTVCPELSRSSLTCMATSTSSSTTRMRHRNSFGDSPSSGILGFVTGSVSCPRFARLFQGAANGKPSPAGVNMCSVSAPSSLQAARMTGPSRNHSSCC